MHFYYIFKDQNREEKLIKLAICREPQDEIVPWFRLCFGLNDSITYDTQNYFEGTLAQLERQGVMIISDGWNGKYNSAILKYIKGLPEKDRVEIFKFSYMLGDKFLKINIIIEYNNLKSGSFSISFNGLEAQSSTNTPIMKLILDSKYKNITNLKKEDDKMHYYKVVDDKLVKLNLEYPEVEGKVTVKCYKYPSPSYLKTFTGNFQELKEKGVMIVSDEWQDKYNDYINKYIKDIPENNKIEIFVLLSKFHDDFIESDIAVIYDNIVDGYTLSLEVGDECYYSSGFGRINSIKLSKPITKLTLNSKYKKEEKEKTKTVESFDNWWSYIAKEKKDTIKKLQSDLEALRRSFLSKCIDMVELNQSLKRKDNTIKELEEDLENLKKEYKKLQISFELSKGISEANFKKKLELNKNIVNLQNKNKELQESLKLSSKIIVNIQSDNKELQSCEEELKRKCLVYLHELQGLKTNKFDETRELEEKNVNLVKENLELKEQIKELENSIEIKKIWIRQNIKLTKENEYLNSLEQEWKFKYSKLLEQNSILESYIKNSQKIDKNKIGEKIESINKAILECEFGDIISCGKSYIKALEHILEGKFYKRKDS